MEEGTISSFKRRGCLVVLLFFTAIQLSSFSVALLINPRIKFPNTLKNGQNIYKGGFSSIQRAPQLNPSHSCSSSNWPLPRYCIFRAISGSSALYAKKNKKTSEEIDYSQYFDEEELEEGFFRGPVGPTPWEADIDVSDPFMFDMDLDSEDDYNNENDEDDEYFSDELDLDLEEENATEMTMDILPNDLIKQNDNGKRIQALKVKIAFRSHRTM